jgi:hypothetical protein
MDKLKNYFFYLQRASTRLSLNTRLLSKLVRGLVEAEVKAAVKLKCALPAKPSKVEPALSFLSPKYDLNNDKPILMYLPWMPTHGDWLIEQLVSPLDYNIVSLEIVGGFDNSIRKELSRFASNNPADYRAILLQHLITVKDEIRGMLFTFDWHPAMRILSTVCEELGIERVLVLHESVFLNKDKYYWHPILNVGRPLAEHVLCWGELQREIFLERGVPPEKLHIVGAPKFDQYFKYQPLLTRLEFFRIYGLDPDKKTFLYAMQPMDMQVDEREARGRQRDAVNDVMDYCEERDVQLVLRTPPSQDNVLFAKDRKRVTDSSNFVIDNAPVCLTPPAESIFHADLILSINSTMLFEALLLGRPALSTKYIEFEQIWDNVGIPAAKSRDSLFEKLDGLLGETFSVDSDGLAWAQKYLAAGDFDGRSSERIVNYLVKFVSSEKALTESVSFLEQFESAAISNSALLDGAGKYVPQMLSVNRVFTPTNIKEASVVNHYVQWGNKPSKSKTRLRNLMRKFGKVPYVIEDGFIRSVEIGLSGEPGLSLSLCGDTAYYDASRISNVEKTLSSDFTLSSEQEEYSRKIISKIRTNKISKYNSSPLLPIQIGRVGVKKVLVLDQRFGDVSVSSAMADGNSFKRMLLDAIRDNPSADIIIKRHPDAIKGGMSTYFSSQNAGFVSQVENVHLVDYDVHPHQLIDICDKVYVVSSGAGMEALLYGKEVYCYGVPFYSNWGVTIDQIELDRRKKTRTVEEIFYVSYIMFSRYYSPSLNRTCSIDECIDYVIKHRSFAV